MNEQPFLSICIPTYNRANYLNLALKAFCFQIATCGRSDISLLVSDNASTDHTREVIQRHQRLFPNLDVLWNETNVGAEENFLGLVRAAKGRFCWIFGDDDLLLEGGLARVIEVLDRKPDIGLLHIASDYHTTPEQALVKKARAGTVDVMDAPGAFLHKVGYSITFITGNIFNLTYLDAYFDYSRFKGSNLLQVSFYLQSLLRGNINAFLGGSVYSAMSDNTGGYGLFRTFGMNFNQILSAFAARGFQEQWGRSINRKLCVSFFPDYLARNRDCRNKSKFHSESPLAVLWPVYKYYPEFWIFVLPLTLLPPRQGNIYYRFCRGVIEAAKALQRLKSGRRQIGI